MKEPHRKGVAKFSNPESCAGGEGIDQGKRRSDLTCAGLRARKAWPGIVGRTKRLIVSNPS